MAVIRHSISLTISNNKYALTKAKILFDNQLSKYINFLINKEREKELKKRR